MLPVENTEDRFSRDEARKFLEKKENIQKRMLFSPFLVDGSDAVRLLYGFLVTDRRHFSRRYLTFFMFVLFYLAL